MTSGLTEASQAARNAHKWLVETEPILENVIRNAGQYSGKYETNVSLAAHIVNATLIGVNCFIYNSVVQAGEDIHSLDEEFRVLAAALVLHDANKYVNSKYDEDVRENARVVLDTYFDGTLSDKGGNGDDFGIEEFLGGDYRDDLLYLIQRTEVYEDSSETRGSETEFRGLERYCRLGDTTASRILNDGLESGVEYLRQNYSLADSDPVQLVEFTTLEQPVLNDLLVSSVKRIISGETNESDHARGIVLGSTTDSVLYLGESIERNELRQRVDDEVRALIGGEFDFSCKLTWNSFDYDILAEIGIPTDEKEQIIADAFRELLERGSAGVEGFEYIDSEFDQHFPILAKAIYLDGQTDFDDEDVQEEYDRIRDEQGPQKAKLHFIAHLVRTYPEQESLLDDLRDDLAEDLHDDLEPKNDAIGMVVDRFFEGIVTPVLGRKGEMCFLCGAETKTKYQKGATALYRTQEYSRRVPPHEKYKSICGVCNLEYALFADVCGQHDVSTSNNVEVAYFYFDEFLGDIRLRAERIGNPVQGETIDLGDLELTAQFVGPQYFLQPVYVIDTNHRMAVVRQIMRTARDVGMKVVFGRPFTRFEAVDEVFRDEEATRPQELLGLDTVERFEDFARPLDLFYIMSMVGRETNMSNPYLQLDRDTFHAIAHFVVVNHDAATRLEAVRSYFETYHNEALMQMKDVARSGKTLYGQHRFGSKYKKTRVFREAIHAFLSGMNQGMDDEAIMEYVESQVYATAKREQFAGRVTTEQASEFVSSVYQYLDENGLYSLKKLSDWENALVNSYYYAFDQLGSEQ